eukprot:58568-Chlamydomonas_euryale.AAC.2
MAHEVPSADNRGGGDGAGGGELRGTVVLLAYSYGSCVASEAMQQLAGQVRCCVGRQSRGPAVLLTHTQPIAAAAAAATAAAAAAVATATVHAWGHVP